MIITIDGPAGAGKSTVAKQLAKRLGFQFLDTGAMYRAIAWLTLQKNVSSMQSPEFQQLLSQIDLKFDDGRVWIDGQEITEQIRQAEVTARVSMVADQVLVRQRLVEQQREIANNGNYVCEGRDQGTVVFPDSKCKFFLTASAEERARRRARDLNQHGEIVTEAEILKQQIERDQRDENRPVGKLYQPRRRD